jgi:hypothetical protein
MDANKFMNIINKDIEIINEDIQKSNKIIKNGFNTLIHNIKKYSKKHPDEFSGIISGIIIFIVIIVIFSVFMHYYCINGQQKTKTGECCSLGATNKRNACYKTTCPIGERNKFGHCCPNGLTDVPYFKKNGGYINCNTTTDQKLNYVAQFDISCIYGRTYDKEYCFIEPCQHSIYQTPSSPRTIQYNTKCCLNGLAPDQEYCNDLHCATNMVTYKGKCCEFGPAKGNNKICNHRIKRNGHRQWWRPKKYCKQFGISGTCCTNGLTYKYSSYCNEKCKDDQVTIQGICCKYGVNVNGTKCFESKCKYSRTINGVCCGEEGVAHNDSHCNVKCQNTSSNHTNNGKCCAAGISISVCSAANNNE